MTAADKIARYVSTETLPWWRIEQLREKVVALETAYSHLDPANGMIAAREASDLLAAIAADLVEAGVQAGYTQRKMARLLGVSESALRGARKEMLR